MLLPFLLSNYYSTIFFSPDGDDSSVRASFHRVSQNGAVVNVEGVKRTYNNLSYCWRDGRQLLKNTSFSLRDIDPVPPNDILLWGRAPVQEDVCGV